MESRYLVSAVLSFGTNLACTWLLHEVAGQPPEVAFAVALITVFVLNFFVARHFVFRADHRPAVSQFRDYVITSLTFRGSEYVGFVVIHRMLEANYLLSAVCVLGASFILKFFAYRNFVFSPPPRR